MPYEAATHPDICSPRSCGELGSANVGALIIRIGLWAPLSGKNIGNYLGFYIRVLGVGAGLII